MKQINDFNKARLQLEPSFQFHSGVTARIETDTPAKLGLTNEFPIYKSALNRMGAALEAITKSIFTEKMNAADLKRDQIYQATRAIVSAGLYHFEPAKQAAAQEVNIVFDAYKKISTAAQEKETGLIVNLLQDLRSDKYKAHVATLGLDEWLVQLENANKEFNDLVEGRIDENTTKITGGSAALNKEVIAAYEVIVRKVNALAVVNGEADYAAFIDYINARIVYFKSILSHQGAKQPANKPNTPEDPDPLPTPDPDENPDIL